MWSWPVSKRLFLDELRESRVWSCSASWHDSHHPKPGLFNLLCSIPWGDHIWERTGRSFSSWGLTDVTCSIGTNTSCLPLSLSCHAPCHRDTNASRGLWREDQSACAKTRVPTWAVPQLCAFLLCETKVTTCMLPVSQCYFIGRLRWNYDCESSMEDTEHCIHASFYC